MQFFVNAYDGSGRSEKIYVGRPCCMAGIFRVSGGGK